LANGDDPLISAYGIAATDDGKHVLAVNAGDSTVGLLTVNTDYSLKLVNAAKAGDKFPVSVATTGKHVVVASVGVDNNHGSISAYVISASGELVAVPDSRRDLWARPSTVAFTRDGRHLIVNELVTGKIKVFAREGDSLSAEPVSMVDSPRADRRFQAIPVGFDIGAGDDGDLVLMSEARFLTPEFGLREEANVVPQTPKYSWQTGSLSSYVVDTNGNISLVAGDVLTGDNFEGGEIANCWVALSPDQRTLWAANALSSSISSFDIGGDGSARLRNATAFKSDPELLFFSDLAVGYDGRTLFQLVGNQGQVMVFDIHRNGDLTHNQTLIGLPTLGAYGLIVL
jgi:6-phosphogluconolactonase (cycloisomerase 2 family)